MSVRAAAWMLLGLPLLLAAAGPARAVSVLVSFEGTLESATDPSGQLTPLVQDASFSATIRYETTTRGRSAAAPPVSVQYDDAITEAQVEIGLVGATIGGTHFVFIRDGAGQPVTSDYLGFVLGNALLTGVPGVDNASFWIDLSGAGGTLDSEALPEEPPPFGAFFLRSWRSSFVLGGQLHALSGTITRFVVLPEPSSATLVLLGLSACVALGRRSARKRR